LKEFRKYLAKDAGWNQERNACDTRRDLLKQFQPLAGNRRLKIVNLAAIAHKHTKGDAGKSRWQWNSRVKDLPRIGFLGERLSSGVRWRHRTPVPEPHGRVAHYRSTVHRFESESSVDIAADAVPELNRFSPVA
jgi:hypothetical protein